MGLKTIYSNIKFFIFQLICILAKMVITFEPVGIFSCGFRCCTQENKSCLVVYAGDSLKTVHKNMDSKFIGLQVFSFKDLPCLNDCCVV